MGTLGCINDMLRRDKENRELRKLNRDRMKEARNRLLEIGKGVEMPDISIEEMEEIRKRTIEKKDLDNAYQFKVKLIFVVCALLLFLLAWLCSKYIYSDFIITASPKECIKTV